MSNILYPISVILSLILSDVSKSFFSRADCRSFSKAEISVVSVFGFSIYFAFELLFNFSPNTLSKSKIVVFLSASDIVDFKTLYTTANASGVEKSSSIFSINSFLNSLQTFPPSGKDEIFVCSFSRAVCEAAKDSQVKFCFER